MAKKPEATDKPKEIKPIASKGKARKPAVDTHQLDLFFTAYNPPVKEIELDEIRETEPATKGIEKILSTTKKPTTAKPQKADKAVVKPVEKIKVAKPEKTSSKAKPAAKTNTKPAKEKQPVAKKKPATKPTKKAKGKK